MFFLSAHIGITDKIQIKHTLQVFLLHEMCHEYHICHFWNHLLVYFYFFVCLFVLFVFSSFSEALGHVTTLELLTSNFLSENLNHSICASDSMSVSHFFYVPDGFSEHIRVGLIEDYEYQNIWSFLKKTLKTTLTVQLCGLSSPTFPVHIYFLKLDFSV